MTIFDFLKKRCLVIIAIVSVLAIFAIVYSPTLFHFFIADDFSYTSFLNDALSHPEILLKTYWFSSRTISPDAAIFYRPLFTTMLFLEAKLWGINSVYFRIVNMIIELLVGMMLGLTVFALNKKLIQHGYISSPQLLTWSIFSFALFILFPLHSEPVNWIAARMDLLVTLFSLLAFWYYIQWRHTSRRRDFILSMISAILAFLTKEMAVALPPTIFAYELLFQQNTLKPREAIYKAGIVTSPYWLSLLIYLCIRKIVLGDFLAGYPDNMTNPLSVSGWLQGLRTIFIPFSSLTIASHSFVFKAWHLILLSLIVLSVIAAIKANKNEVRIVYFLTIWFLLCLSPVYKVFPTHMGCISGSRLVYLASAPLCALLMYGATTLGRGNKLSFIFRFIASIFLVLAAIVLYTNNIAWAEAGHLSNKIVKEFKDYYQNIADDPFVYVSGLPTITNKGVAICAGMFSGMLRKPIMDRNLYHCVRVDSDDQFTSFGCLKAAVTNNKKQASLLYWDLPSDALTPVLMFPEHNIAREWDGGSMRQIINLPQVPSISEPEAHWLKDGTLEVISHKKSDTCTILELNLKGQSCWYMDFLALKIRFSKLKNLGIFHGAALFFTNEIAKEYTKEYFRDYFVSDCCRASLQLTDEEQEIVFPLRNLPAWSMGGKCNNIRIVLPTDCNIQVTEVSLPEAKNMMPFIDLKSSINATPGKIQLDGSHNTYYVQYEAKSIKGCKQVVLEVTQPLEFKDSRKEFFITKRSANTCGQFPINRKELPSEKSVCRARLRALDGRGNQIGFPSDFFFICVDS